MLLFGQIKASDVTFDNTIKALIDLEREMITEEGPIFLPQHVVTDKAIRDASVAADKKLSTFEVDLSMKKEVRPLETLKVRMNELPLFSGYSHQNFTQFGTMVVREVSYMTKCK